MLVLSGVISFVMLVSLFWWIGLLIYQKGNILRIAEMVIPAIKRVPSHWGFVTALVAFGLLQLIASIGITVLRAYGFVTFPVGDAVLTEAQTQQNFASMLSATLIAQIVTSFVVVGWAISRPGTRFANLSLDFKVTDIADGLKATVLLLPPVLMISGLVNHFIPYEHVVLESLKSMDSVGELTLVFATTAIVTPVYRRTDFPSSSHQRPRKFGDVGSDNKRQRRGSTKSSFRVYRSTKWLPGINAWERRLGRRPRCEFEPSMVAGFRQQLLVCDLAPRARRSTHSTVFPRHGTWRSLSSNPPHMACDDRPHVTQHDDIGSHGFANPTRRLSIGTEFANVFECGIGFG